MCALRALAEPRNAASFRRHAIRESTATWSDGFWIHCMPDAAVYPNADCAGLLESLDRPSFARGRMRPSLHELVFFVLIGLVQGQSTEFVGDLKQVLVSLVPIGADFAKE